MLHCCSNLEILTVKIQILSYFTIWPKLFHGFKKIFCLGSLTSITPSSDSFLSLSQRKSSPPTSLCDNGLLSDKDTLDGLPPPSSSETQPLTFPEVSVLSCSSCKICFTTNGFLNIYLLYLFLSRHLGSNHFVGQQCSSLQSPAGEETGTTHAAHQSSTTERCTTCSNHRGLALSGFNRFVWRSDILLIFISLKKDS